MLHLETVSPELYHLLIDLQSKEWMHSFRLVGGTALALQYGHRVSVDLHFFGQRELGELSTFLSSYPEAQKLNSNDHIAVYIIKGIKVDFVHYPYPWLQPPIVEKGMTVATDADIAAMKIAAITGGGSKKDFVDVYFLLQKYSLEEMLDFFSSKYPDATEILALKSLLYTTDADREPLPKMLQPFDWEAAKEFIRREVRKFF